MKQFDFNKVVEKYGITLRELAPILFPNAKYPLKAIYRIADCKAELSISQVEKLAAYLGVFVTDLFNIDSARAYSDNNNIKIVNGEYAARINYNGSFITIFHNAELISQEVINTNAIKFTDLLKYISLIIKKYENGNN